MKKFIIILILFAVNANSAETKDKWLFTISYDKAFFNEETVNIYGLNIELFVTENISLNYSVKYGALSNDYYFHTTAGIIGGYDILANIIKNELHNYNEDDNSLDLLYTGSVILMILPEGINFNYPLSNYISLSTSFHPFGYDYFKYRGSLSTAVGFRLIYNLSENMVLIPNAGCTLLYNYKDHLTYSLGIAFGVKL
jgi:hypothetical protein